MPGRSRGARRMRGAAWKLVTSDGLSGDSGWRWPTRAVLGGGVTVGLVASWC